MSIVDRAKNILLTPSEEWNKIDQEPADIGRLYAGYIMPLAAIGPVASVIGMSMVGMSFMGGGTFRVPLDSALAYAAVSYALSLAGVFILALVIDALAPTFAGTKSQTQALKVAAYSSTAIWLAGIFAIVPMLAILSLLGLYSLYLLYLGLPVLMKSPQSEALGYTVVVTIAAIVLRVIVVAITTLIVHYLSGFPLQFQHYFDTR